MADLPTKPVVRRILDAIYDVSGVLAGLFVLSIFLVMLGTSVMRLVGLRTGGFEEIIAWLTAAAAFTGLASTFKHGDFVRVELLLARLPAGYRRGFELLSLGIATVFLGYMAWSTFAYVLDSYRFGDMAGGLIAIPIWIPQTSFIVGTILLFVAMLDEFIRVARGSRPTYVVAVEQRHARGDFTEDV
jgi:TRAP-type C4-dicarboxylate transport system permease small subunit